MKTPIESWPRCPQTSLSKERHVIIENGQKLTAGEDYLPEASAGGAIERRQRPGLILESRLKTALR